MAKNSGQAVLMVAGGFLVFGGLAAFSRQASASTSKGGTMKANIIGAKGVLPSVVKWSRAFGAPPSLVMAIIETESRFNANATNLTSPGDVARGGAWGLGQLTLKTAKGLYQSAKGKVPAWDGTGNGLLNPELNVALTAYGVAQNWNRFRPDWLAAGLAWNVGAGGVAKRTKSWVSSHPYALRILGYRATNPVTAELYTQEKPSFAYA
jgi:soluble lytic murein transglycosylase-like protein